MARFRGVISGNRGLASRLGSKDSGLTVHANGWDTGVTVTLSVGEDGKDVVRVHKTGGSNGGGSELIAEWTEGE